MTEDVEPSDLERWLAEGRAGEAARARVRERWLRTQAGEEARLAEVLWDLAERQAAVTVLTRSGDRISGRVAGAGEDFLAVRDRHLTLVPAGAIAAVTEPGATPRRRRRPDAGEGSSGPGPGPRPRPGPAGPGSDRAERRPGDPVLDAGATLLDVLAQASGFRPRVAMRTDGARPLTGTLSAVGRDLAVVELDDGAGLAYVPVPSASLAGISFLDSG